MESLFSQMLTGATEMWLSFAYIVCVFALAVFRPERIGDANLFRISYLVFAAHLVTLPIANVVLNFLTFDDMGRRTANGGSLFVIQFGSLVSRGLLALSIVLALGSIVLTKASEEQE